MNSPILKKALGAAQQVGGLVVNFRLQGFGQTFKAEAKLAENLEKFEGKGGTPAEAMQALKKELEGALGQKVMLLWGGKVC